jgi:hypothetical protein
MNILQSPALEDAAHWRELALVGATLTSADLRAWSEVIDRARAELDGAVTMCKVVAPTVGSSAAARAEDWLIQATERLDEDSEACAARMHQVLDEAEAMFAKIKPTLAAVTECMRALTATMKAASHEEWMAHKDAWLAESTALDAQNQALDAERDAFRLLVDPLRSRKRAV